MFHSTVHGSGTTMILWASRLLSSLSEIYCRSHTIVIIISSTSLRLVVLCFSAEVRYLLTGRRGSIGIASKQRLRRRNADATRPSIGNASLFVNFSYVTTTVGRLLSISTVAAYVADTGWLSSHVLTKPQNCLKF